MTPRILFSDKDLSRTDIDLLSLIISLTLNSNYCYASNKYLADYINSSIRTISDSLSKLKRLNYIIIKYENNNRRIYLNTEKIPIKDSNLIAEKCTNAIAKSRYHNINSKYKNNYKINKFKKEGIIPHWMNNPEVCKSTPLTEEEEKELKEMLKEFM